ncbi:tRNA glutamyl-Q(34) synthetase GluQRS [bacterium]|nr:tRNA glutamyl-Q(34) synthetase GluQRS [bacterium]
MAVVTRFAPSPTGPLHLGHAYAAIVAHDLARSHGGTFLLRIEDIDQTRCRPEWEAQIADDLHWLGLSWPTPVLRQSDRVEIYRAALQSLWQRGLLYPCSCSRRDILEAASAPQEGAAPLIGPDGPVYPGTCRARHRQSGPLPSDCALRLDMSKAAALLMSHQDHAPNPLEGVIFLEVGQGPQGQHGLIATPARHLTDQIGDIVLARREMGTSYHLSVVLDDAAQGVTHVTRGEDLFEATAIHVVLQRLLGLPTPIYHHHRLIRDAQGKRLAKRDDARALARYRAEGASPADIRHMIGL